MATRRDRYAAERLRLQAGLEVALARRSARLVRADLLAAADPSRDGGALNLALGPHLDAWRRLFLAHGAVTARSFGRHTLASLGDVKASWLNMVLGWIEVQAARKARLVLETTVGWLREKIAEGEEQGLGVPEIARTIRSAADGISRARALTIARTETHAASTYASEAAAVSTGLDLAGEWIATEDARTRESHAAADGQKRPIGEPFDVGGAVLMRPGDPDAPPEETINCRCQVLYDTVRG